ncbi:MAG TPA: ATP-binding protein [Thermoanaerobaculia bacterium]|jgi:signal transduction histidine kinase|nr:ATP-binding protein [Thermoanaerobaculia bacterium]
MNTIDHVRGPRRFKPAYALTAAIALLVAGILISVWQDRVFRAQRVREVRVQGEILAASLTAALIFGDAKTVQEHVSALQINPEIEAAGVYDEKQGLVASFVRKGEEPLPRSASDPITDVSGRRAIVVLPVEQDSVHLGIVFIRTTDEPLGRTLTRHAAVMLLAVMAAVLMAFMGTSQRTLREANRQLEARALALAEANELLQNEMEERTKAEDALRQSQKMEAVGQLSGGIAHDFNNLLTIIQGNLHLLKHSAPGDPSAIPTYIDGANEAADRAGHLVRRLLTFSRRQPLSPRSVDLSELAAGMKALILHSVGKVVRIEWHLEATWKTLCDVNQMENVILNLAINARDAMPERGTLTIETSDLSLPAGALAGEIAPGDYVEVRMRDTGTGMTEEVRKRAVDPFFTTKPHGQGTGLGLSMAFGFIRQSNGYLNIETVPGKGTTIAILLPRHSEAESPETS